MVTRERIIDGRYRLGRQLGEGAMGTVWEALDLRLERHVAIKLVGSGAVGRDPRARERFEREAKLLAGLSSPFIVTVHDVGETVFEGDQLGQTVLYLVMERLHGRSLDEVLAQELPPLAEVARWGEQICRALAVAHESGVVHRDLKPANVMVGPDGLARVLDFGIAAVLAESTDHARLTSTGVVVGTPSYMSPEQIEGGTVEFRSDLYSTGCVLYALVTGRAPFGGPSLYQLLRQQMESDPEPPSERRAGVSAEWDRLVLALLAKRPEDRPASATEVAERLRALSLTAVASVAVPASPVAGALGYEPTRVDPRSVLLASCPHPDGGRLPLATGQRMRLGDVLPGASEFTVGVGWRVADGLDVDASALVVDEDGQVLSDDHFVFYNNPEPSGVGVRLGGDDAEALFSVRLPELPEGARRVVFALSLDGESADGGDLFRVEQPHLRLLDAGAETELLCYGFPRGPAGVLGVTVGELVRDDEGWLFSASSSGFPGGLAEIAESHGVLVEA
ncbi:protein kinase domain-containing protein [Streptomyces profundus]|uniref:protein kinase domain-containing protein n=1 Tax=Streptomyces profundus TaxID=2867410 RepID=UPI001D16D811|nr:TerD family protein [Streptomyces sp. MA3_2.13]UED85663.1 TerD family protein [Streptomyces sp. MA3_2.13]